MRRWRGELKDEYELKTLFSCTKLEKKKRKKTNLKRL